MIQLSIARLQDFQKRTQYIQRHTTLPMLSYLKLHVENGNFHLTKNNLAAICVMVVGENAPPDTPTLLLDDRILFSYLSAAAAKQITITWTDKEIQLTDGKQPVTFQRQDPTDFPRTPEFNEATNEYKMPTELLATLAVAKNFVNDSETAGNQKFIHLRGEYVFAMSTNCFFLCNRFKDLPELRLDKQQADILSGLQEVEFGSIGNHYFFLAGDSIFIFTKQEGQSPAAISNIHERLRLPGKEFQIMRDELTSFCNVANMVSEGPLVPCSMVPAGPVCSLRMVDASFNRGTSRDVMVTGTFDQFNFDSRLFQTPMKAIPYEILEAKTNQNNFIITGQDEYFCFIGMAN